MDLADLGSLADQLSAVRAERLLADKAAAELKSQEETLKRKLADSMRAKGLSSVGGRVCIVKRQVKERAIAQSWPEIQGYIKETDSFDLLHRRLTDSAVFVRREDGIIVPGIGFMDYDHLTYSEAPR